MSSNPCFIIPNFFYTVQHAAIELISKKPPTADATQIALNNKIKKIAIAHLTGAAIIAVGTIITLAALPYITTTALGCALLAGLGIAIYAAGHDVFVMANNAQTSENAIKQMMEKLQENGIIDPNAFLKVMTRDTYYQPLIMKFLPKHLPAAPATSL